MITKPTVAMLGKVVLRVEARVAWASDLGAVLVVSAMLSLTRQRHVQWLVVAFEGQMPTV